MQKNLSQSLSICISVISKDSLSSFVRVTLYFIIVVFDKYAKLFNTSYYYWHDTSE